MMHNPQHIMPAAVVLIALTGCADERMPRDESQPPDGLTKFEIAADDLAASLDNRGILLDHDFEGFEDGTVSDDFQVVSGHGQAVKSEIEAIVRKLDPSKEEESSMKITVLEEDDRDIVLWFHKAERP